MKDFILPETTPFPRTTDVDLLSSARGFVVGSADGRDYDGSSSVVLSDVVGCSVANSSSGGSSNGKAHQVERRRKGRRKENGFLW